MPTFVIIWPVVLADIMESMCSDWLTGQLKDPETKQKEIKLGKHGFFQIIVATGNGQPPESPFYYPDKIKV